jgi:hypothetical protein
MALQIRDHLLAALALLGAGFEGVMLAYGGSGYFPQFKLPAWMVFPRDSDSATLKQAIDGLRQLAREEQTRVA